MQFQSILATFNTPGTFDIQLQYETNCCGISLPQTLTLVVEEVPNISAFADAQLCQGEPGGVELYVSGVNPSESILWSPSAGLSNINSDTVVALPVGTTEYIVTVENSTGYCQDNDTVLVEIIDLDLQATSTLSNCAVLGTIDLSVLGGSGDYSFAWDNGEVTEDLNGLQPGDYQVVVSDNIIGCTDSLIVNVSAGPAALTAQESVTHESCDNENDGRIIIEGFDGTPPYTFNWTNLGITNNGLSDTISSLSPGNYEIVVTDGNGCIFTVNTTINAADSFVFAVDSFKNTTCLGLEDGYVRIKVDGGLQPYTFAWSSGMPIVLDNGDIVADNVAPSSYYLIVADDRVCTDSLLVEFTVPPVTTNLLNDTVCVGNEYDFLGDIITIIQDTVLEDTSYLASGCADEINIANIFAAENPIASLTASPDTVFENQTSTLEVDAGYFYDWTPTSSSSSSSIEVQPLTNTSYSVIVTDDLGCSETYSITVYVLEREVELHIPDAFSPNGDGVNDIFRVVNSDYFEDIDLKVYNRWGELIHQSEGFNHGWDGTYKNEKQAVDVYTFTVTAISTFSGNKITVSGNVSLIK